MTAEEMVKAERGKELDECLVWLQKRIELLEGAIDRQNKTTAYLNSTNGQGFNW